MSVRGFVRRSVLGSAAILLTLPLRAGAQTQTPELSATPASPGQVEARHQIAALERVLESAVGSGAQVLNQHIQASATPQSVLLSGLARARGFRLTGYGVLFDVEFPSIRRSVAWTLRTLGRPDPELLAAMKQLRKNTQDVADPLTRQELDRSIKALEDELKANGQATNVSTDNSRPPAAAVPAEDPRAIYAAELSKALVNAILDQGSSVGVTSDEWLTIAARESLDLRFTPDDASGTVTTLMLRIKGSDLQALRDQRITRDEARRRIEIKQY